MHHSSLDYTSVFCNGLNQTLWFIGCVPSLSCSPVIAPLTGTIPYANNLQVKLLINNIALKVKTNSIWQQELLMSLSWEFSLQSTNLFLRMLEWFCASAFLFCMLNIQISSLDPIAHYKFYSYCNTACSMCHKPGKSRGGFLWRCLYLCFTSTPFEGKANRKI